MNKSIDNIKKKNNPCAVKSDTQYTFIDLFAGIGGFHTAMHSVGCKCVFASEWDKAARVSYEANYSKIEPKLFEKDKDGNYLYFNEDINDVVPEKVPNFDICCGGFPCQPFSVAGLKRGFEDTRGTLFFNIVNLVKEKITSGCPPKVLFLENVRGLKNHDKGKTLQVILATLEELGYNYSYEVLNAKYFGVPQNRERLFIIAWYKDLVKSDSFNFPYGIAENGSTIYSKDEIKKGTIQTKVSDIFEPSDVTIPYTISDRMWEGHKARKERNKMNGKGFGYSLFNGDSVYSSTISARYWKDGSEILIDQSDKCLNPRTLTPVEAGRLQGYRIIGSGWEYPNCSTNFLPNQWFYIASYFTELYNELQRYKQEAIKVVSSERLKSLNGNSLLEDEKQRLQNLSMDETSRSNLEKFMTDYSWWNGAKTIDRGDFYVSPILNCAKLVNASQSYIADLCAFLANKKDLVDAIIHSVEEGSSANVAKQNSIALQQIYYGTPGSGKSRNVKRIVEKIDEDFVFRTTFHPDSDYASFVGCYKPVMKSERNYMVKKTLDELKEEANDITSQPAGNKVSQVIEFVTKYATLFPKIVEDNDEVQSMQNLLNKHLGFSNETYLTYIIDYVIKNQKHDSKISYEFTPQTFTKAYVAAWNHPEQPIYLIIEEINRGNCAQIFGDLFQLLDRENGVSEYPIDADNDLKDYLEQELGAGHEGIKNGKLKLPSNLNILATMNTSDQSLFPMDSAFKRRWAWECVPVDYTNQDSRKFTIKIGDSEYKWHDFLLKANNRIKDLTFSEDKQMGNFFISSNVDKRQFIDKVMFYLWNDICKDEYGSGSFFRRYIDNNNPESEFSFNDLFGEENKIETILNGFMEYLAVEKIEAATSTGEEQ